MVECANALIVKVSLMVQNNRETIRACTDLELLFLNNCAPSHPKLWYNYICELSLPFPVNALIFV